MRFSRQYYQMITYVSKHIDDVYGEDVGRAFRKAYASRTGEAPFAGVAVDGQIDWTKVELERGPTTVRVRIAEAPFAYARMMPDGRWYRLFGETPEASLAILAYSERLIRDGVRDIREIRDGVRTGAFTKAELLERIGN
jgi:hypothetical protein